MALSTLSRSFRERESLESAGPLWSSRERGEVDQTLAVRLPVVRVWYLSTSGSALRGQQVPAVLEVKKKQNRNGENI
jgi:hypothetical protein